MCEILRSDALVTCLRSLTIDGILNVMCTMTFPSDAKELALECIVKRMQEHIPEISDETWKTKLKVIKPNQRISYLKHVYSSFVLCQGKGLDKDRWHYFVRRHLDPINKCSDINIDMMILCGFFSSQAARNALREYADQRIAVVTAENDAWWEKWFGGMPDDVIMPEHRDAYSKRCKFNLSCWEILKELTEKSYNLQRIVPWQVSPTNFFWSTHGSLAVEGFENADIGDESDPKTPLPRITVNKEDMRRLIDKYTEEVKPLHSMSSFMEYNAATKTTT
jgi:hypothetical protein